MSNTGALIIRTGFRVFYATTMIRNPPKEIVKAIIDAPILFQGDDGNLRGRRREVRHVGAVPCQPRGLATGSVWVVGSNRNSKQQARSKVRLVAETLAEAFC